MRPGAVRRELGDLISRLAIAELVVDTNPILEYRHRDDVTVTFGSPIVPEAVLQQDSSSIGEYRAVLGNRHYAALLWDGSVLQTTYRFRRDDIVGHRLVFLPCPFVLSPEEFDGPVDPLTIVDGLIAREARTLGNLFAGSAEVGRSRLRLRSPIRFEMDPNAVGLEHPTTHAHLWDVEGRIPVYGPVSVGHFVRFVFRHYYPDEWSAHDWLREWALKHAGQTITAPDELELHFASHRAQP